MVKATTTTPSKAPSVGDRAPALDLVTGKDAKGNVQRFNLHEAVHKGPVVVAFFPGAFTSTCTKELCTFRDTLSDYAKLDAQVVGVSVDGPQVQKAFAEKHNLPMAFASDTQRNAIRDWNVVWDSWWGPVAQRGTFVVDRNGVVRFAEVLANPDHLPNFAEIQATLKRLQ